jgi:excisionase family DNA binding protein
MPKKDFKKPHFAGNTEIIPRRSMRKCFHADRHTRPVFCGGSMETYLTIFELAEKTKLSISALRRAVQLHEIPFHRFMRRVRFKPSEIDAWIASGGCKGMGAGEGTGTAHEGQELFTGPELVDGTGGTGGE